MVSSSAHEVADTLHLLGADFRECLLGVLSAGFPFEEAILAVQRYHEDPHKAVHAILDLLAEQVSSQELVGRVGLPESLEAMGIHPLSIRLYSQFENDVRLPIHILNWLESPAWNPPDPFWGEGVSLRQRSQAPPRVSGIRFPTLRNLALVLPYQIEFRDSEFGAECSSLWATVVTFWACRGLRRLPPLQFHPDQTAAFLMLEALPDLEELPAGLVLDELIVTDCPRLRSLTGLQVGTLILDRGTGVIPSDFRAGHIEIRNSPQLTFPFSFSTPGSMTFAEDDISRLPENLEVGMNLTLRDCRGQAMPRGIQVGGEIEFNDLPELSMWPEGHAGNVHVRKCPQLPLPGDRWTGVRMKCAPRPPNKGTWWPAMRGKAT